MGDIDYPNATFEAIRLTLRIVPEFAGFFVSIDAGESHRLGRIHVWLAFGMSVGEEVPRSNISVIGSSCSSRISFLPSPIFANR